MTDWNHSTPLAAASAFAQAMIPLRVEGADPTNPALDTFEQISLTSVIAAAAASVAPSAGSSSAQAVSIDLFVNLATHALPAAVTALIVGGYSTGGVGGGTYVADPLATSALAARFPRFCAADSTGRVFRLLPPGGTLAISQGGALGGTRNDQPAVQAAIDYAAAIGARTLLFDFDTVSIWNTVRTSASGQTSTDAWAQDGQSIWVTAPIKFLGLATQTRIKMLSATGTSLENGWQTVASVAGEDGLSHVWRGSGINLIGGSQASPNANNLTFFAMENIWLDGGCSYTGVRSAVTPTSPDGPDLTNKGIRLQNTQCDNVMLINSIISGFKGEACYIAGTSQTIQILKNVRVSGSNQSAFNPSTGVVWASDCKFGNSFISCECLGGIGGVYNNVKFYDSVQTGITGGPANGLTFNYAFPTRDTTKAPPWIDLVNCDFHNAGQMLVGNYIRISGRSTDTAITLSTAITNGSLTSTYINLDVTLDQANLNPLCVVQGPPTTTTVIAGATGANYIQPVNDLHLRFNIRRTAHAKANGYFCVPFSDSGLIDQDTCTVIIDDCDGVTHARDPNYGGGTSLAMPLIVFEGPTNSQSIGAGIAFGAFPLTTTGSTYALPVSNPRHVLINSGSPGSIAVTMAAPYSSPGGYPNGQEVEIYGNGGGTTWTFARNGTGLRLNADCALTTGEDMIKVKRHNGTGLWHEIGRSVYTP